MYFIPSAEKSLRLYPPIVWLISHSGLCPVKAFLCGPVLWLPLTEIQTSKSRERNSTLTLVSYVFPSNSRASYISAPQSTDSSENQTGHTVGSRREWGQTEAPNG